MTVAIVGAGPSGMLVAVLLARAGRAVRLIDENAETGGHLTYDQYSLPRGAGSTELRAELETALRQSGTTLSLDSVVWGAFRTGAGIELAVNRKGAQETVACELVIVASGTTDRALPLLGSTLPGVMTARAARILGERHSVVPGERFAIIGTGNEADRLAKDIDTWGARVEAIVDPDTVRRITGQDCVHAIETTGGASDVDVVVIAVGELPDVQLPAMLELQRVYDPTVGGWRVEPRIGTDDVLICGGAALGGAAIGPVLRTAIDVVASVDCRRSSALPANLKIADALISADREGQG